ncbi:hypothetical protein BGZ83_009446 [Gryganskiella cystojenkinii]|nr:hypothetical protein BGZ83_009446 [Gryganskiella cystojenkinii]
MKIFTTITLALAVLAVTTTTTTAAASALESAPAGAIEGELVHFLTGAVPLGALSGTVDPATKSPLLLEKRCPSCRLGFQQEQHRHHRDRHNRHGRSHRRYRDHAMTVTNALVNVNTNIIAKALLKLKLDLCSDIKAKVKVLASGLLTLNTDIVIPKIQAKIDAEINSAINTKVDLDAHVLVLKRIRKHSHTCIKKYCPTGPEDDWCLRKHAHHIVREVEALVSLDIQHLFLALKTDLMTHIRANVQVMVRDLGVNLLVEQIHIQAVVDAVAQLNVHLDLCSHIIIKGLHVSVLPTVLKSIRSLTGGL